MFFVLAISAPKLAQEPCPPQNDTQGARGETVKLKLPGEGPDKRRKQIKEVWRVGFVEFAIIQRVLRWRVLAYSVKPTEQKSPSSILTFKKPGPRAFHLQGRRMV